MGFNLTKLIVAVALTMALMTFTYPFVSMLLQPVAAYYIIYIYLSYQLIESYEKYKSNRREDSGSEKPNQDGRSEGSRDDLKP